MRHDDQFLYWLKQYTDRTRFDTGDMAACWYAAQRNTTAHLGEASVEQIMDESAKACREGIREFDDAHSVTQMRLTTSSSPPLTAEQAADLAKEECARITERYGSSYFSEKIRASIGDPEGVKALVADAERYRLVRTLPGNEVLMAQLEAACRDPMTPEQFDAAIDSARKAGK